MSLLDFLTGKIRCPNCGASGAKESGGQILCPNPACAYYDRSREKGGQPRPAPQRATMDEAARSFVAARPVTLRYRNFRGEEQTFTVDGESGVQKKNFLSLKVAPSGQRIAFLRERIQNLREIEGAIPERVAPGQAWPSARERQVLSYHKKYKTTSPLYEKIRAKYPDW
jgi:hypothetical protein